MSLFRKRKTKPDPGPGEFHQSGSYHRFFEGWAEYETVNAKGRVRIRRVYVGNYYCIDLPKQKRNWLRVFLWAVSALALLLFIFGATRNTVQNQSAVMAFFQFVSVFGYLSLFFALGNLRQKMMIYDYKAGPCALKKRSIVTAIASALCLFLTVVLSAVQSSFTENVFITIICFAVSTIIPIVIARIVHRLPVCETTSTAQAPDGSVVIHKT